MELHVTVPRPATSSGVIRSLSAPPSPSRITLVGAEPFLELYQPLLPWQTRLIELLPGHDLAPIECRLETVEVTAQEGLGLIAEARLQEYEVLSCSAAPLEPVTSLICNGVSIPVPLSLSEALSYMRLESESRWLWNDSLCINHDDPHEKSIQVRESFLVHKKAINVIAWIGTPNEDCDMVLEAIDNFPLSGLGEASDMQYAVRSFVASRPWFQDIWSRQAVSAAQNLLLQCGDFVFSFHQFCRFALKAGGMGDCCLEVLYNDHLESGKKVLHGYDKDLTDYFFDTLSKNASFNAADPRDRIYSSITLIDSLWKKSGRKGFLQYFPIDYAQPASCVSEQLTEFLVNRDQSLAILSVLGPRTLTGFRTPSWACDWALSGLFLPTERRRSGSQTPLISMEDGRLTLQGSFIGLVDEELDYIAEPFLEAHNSAKLRSKRSSVNLNSSSTASSSSSSSSASPSRGSGKKSSKHKDADLLDLCSRGDYTFRTIKFADGTRSTSLGIAAPIEAQIGDEIAIMNGCNAPFVLRWTDQGFNVVGACWMWNTFVTRPQQDELLYHYCDFDSWSQNFYRHGCNTERTENQARIRRALKTMTWHRQYWLETGAIHSDAELGPDHTFDAFRTHADWIKHAQSGNAIREYVLC
ncbi:hypothetical protein DV737_g2759, partial [Chaetothyriales sp. CBS 132003]